MSGRGFLFRSQPCLPGLSGPKWQKRQPGFLCRTAPTIRRGNLTRRTIDRRRFRQQDPYIKVRSVRSWIFFITEAPRQTIDNAVA
jgi:hypothetical protein